MVSPLSWYLVLTCFIPDIISDLPLLLHACTDLKSIFPDFVCKKRLPFTKKTHSYFHIVVVFGNGSR